jgi:hypothetical protein
MSEPEHVGENRTHWIRRKLCDSKPLRFEVHTAMKISTAVRDEESSTFL